MTKLSTDSDNDIAVDIDNVSSHLQFISFLSDPSEFHFV